MLCKRIIPCLDVDQGRVVKGVKFVSLRDAGDPVECAIAYDQAKADELVFLDISASHEGRKILLDVVRRVAEEVFMPFTVGGGIRTIQEIQALLRAGCDKVSINTSAVQNPDFVRRACERFGSQCVVVAVDAKRSAPHRWCVYTHGGQRRTDLDAIGWADRVARLGAGEILLTSMDRDGTREGYDLELTGRISKRVPIPVIASGGAGSLRDLYEACVQGNASGLLVASLFHFGDYSIKEVKRFLRRKGISIRL